MTSSSTSLSRKAPRRKTLHRRTQEQRNSCTSDSYSHNIDLPQALNNTHLNCKGVSPLNTESPANSRDSGWLADPNLIKTEVNQSDERSERNNCHSPRCPRSDQCEERLESFDILLQSCPNEIQGASHDGELHRTTSPCCTGSGSWGRRVNRKRGDIAVDVGNLLDSFDESHTEVSQLVGACRVQSNRLDILTHDCWRRGAEFCEAKDSTVQPSSVSCDHNNTVFTVKGHESSGISVASVGQNSELNSHIEEGKYCISVVVFFTVTLFPLLS